MYQMEFRLGKRRCYHCRKWVGVEGDRLASKKEPVMFCSITCATMAGWDTLEYDPVHPWAAKPGKNHEALKARKPGRLEGRGPLQYSWATGREWYY